MNSPANLRADRWAGADFWAGAVERVTLQELLARCEVITTGTDGGGLDDLLGFALFGAISLRRSSTEG